MRVDSLYLAKMASTASLDGGTGSTSEVNFSMACSECAERWRSQSKPGEAVVDGKGRATFTVCDVGLHNSEHDLWLHAHGRVYDVTAFVQQHPGGPRALLRHGGQDSTEDFDFHSISARSLWTSFAIGAVRHCKANPAATWIESCSIQ